MTSRETKSAPNLLELAARFQRGEGESLTVPQLRQIAAMYDVSVPTKILKRDLIALVEEGERAVEAEDEQKVSVSGSRRKSASDKGGRSPYKSASSSPSSYSVKRHSPSGSSSPQRSMSDLCAEAREEAVEATKAEMYALVEADTWNPSTWRLPSYFREIEDPTVFTHLLKEVQATDLLPSGAIMHLAKRSTDTYARRLYVVSVQMPFDEMPISKFLIAEPKTKSEQTSLMVRHSGFWLNFPYRRSSK
jgi:hypothetical protein